MILSVIIQLLLARKYLGEIGVRAGGAAGLPRSRAARRSR